MVPDRGLTGAHVLCLQLTQASVLLAVYFRSCNYMNLKKMTSIILKHIHLFCMCFNIQFSCTIYLQKPQPVAEHLALLGLRL